MLVDAKRSPVQRVGMANMLGAELFGDARLARLVACSTCGCLGKVGDDCGRAPVGHRLSRG